MYSILNIHYSCEPMAVEANILNISSWYMHRNTPEDNMRQPAYRPEADTQHHLTFLILWSSIHNDMCSRVWRT